MKWAAFQKNALQNILKLVKADKNHVVRLTVVESFERIISMSCSTLLVAPIGVQNGWIKTNYAKLFKEIQHSSHKQALTTAIDSRNLGQIW